MPRREGSFRVAAVIAGAALLLQASWIRYGFAGPDATQAFNDLLPVPICAMSALACWLTGRRATGLTRRGWLLLGAAVASWGIGEAVWSYYEIVERRDVPFPSLADVGFLAMIPLAVGAMLSFGGGKKAVTQARLALEGITIAGSVLFVSWVAVLGQALNEGTGTRLEQAIALAYPIGDVALITLVFFASPQISARSRLSIALMGEGLVAIAFADSGFTYLTQNDAYQTGNPIDAGWTAGFLLIWLAALRARRFAGAGVSTEARPSRGPVVATYAATAGAMVAAGYQQVANGALTPFLFWTAMAVVGSLLLHQLLLTVENLSLTHDLENKVRLRTEALLTALEEVEESNRLQNAFVASVSHELRTPLTNLLGAAATLERPELGLSADAMMLVRASQRNGDRMMRLVEDLLLVAGLAEPEPHRGYPFDVVAEARQAVADSPVAGRAQILAPAHAMGAGSPARFRISLGHVLANAAKFAPTGPVRVDVRASEGEVVVTVTDEGPGVPVARRDRIFDRFVQADDSSTREHEGAGLGLFIARRSLQGMGGSISLVPTTSGATFRLSVPTASNVVPFQVAQQAG